MEWQAAIIYQKHKSADSKAAYFFHGIIYHFDNVCTNINNITCTTLFNELGNNVLTILFNLPTFL